MDEIPRQLSRHGQSKNAKSIINVNCPCTASTPTLHPPQQRSSVSGLAVLYSAPTTTAHRGPRCPSTVTSGVHMEPSAMRVVGTLCVSPRRLCLSPHLAVNSRSISNKSQPVVRPPDQSDLIHMQRIVRQTQAHANGVFYSAFRSCCHSVQMTPRVVPGTAGATS